METLIAVFVLSLAITGPFMIAQKGLQAGLISKDQITAFYLAQDAIEYIRYARDTNCLVAGSVAGGCPAPLIASPESRNPGFIVGRDIAARRTRNPSWTSSGA